MKFDQARYEEYISVHKEQCARKEKALREDDRCDEANLQKVRYNVYDIFGTLYVSAEKMINAHRDLSGDEKDQAVYERFMELCEKIPKNWYVSYEKAKKAGMIERVVIEEEKIQIVEQLKQYIKDQCVEES